MTQVLPQTPDCSNEHVTTLIYIILQVKQKRKNTQVDNFQNTKLSAGTHIFPNLGPTMFSFHSGLSAPSLQLLGRYNPITSPQSKSKQSQESTEKWE